MNEKELKEGCGKMIVEVLKEIGGYELVNLNKLGVAKKAISVTINKRNAEVKQTILNWANEEKQLGNKGYNNLILRTKRKLLQKLGLEE